MDISEISILPVVTQSTSISEMMMITERFPHLNYQLSILPCYPISDKQDHGYPLLANVPRM